MDRIKINYLREFTVTQMNHWAFFPVYLFLSGLFQQFTDCDDPGAAIWLAAGLVPFLFYGCRVGLSSVCAGQKTVPGEELYTKGLHAKGLLARLSFLQFPLLVASHLAVIFLFVRLMPYHTEGGRFLLGFVGFCYGIYSLSLRLRQDSFQDGEVFMPLVVGLSAASCYLVRTLGYAGWENRFVFALIGVFGLYCLNTYLKRFLGFLSVNESSMGHIPEKEIFISGGKLILAFTAFAMATLLLVSHIEWLQAILRVLRELLLTIFRFLFSLLPEMTPGTVTPDGMEQVVEGQELEQVVESADPFFLWKILEAAVLTGLLFLLLWGACKLFYHLFLFIRSKMAHMPWMEENTIGGIVDIHEKCGIGEKKLRAESRNLWKFLSPEERIRKIYRKHILVCQNFSEGNPAFLTAREWGEILGETGMSNIYEKARYSGETCTAEDVRRMKEVCRT